MNTERRHELETNTLAKGLNEWGEKLRPYSSAILGVIAALLAIYIVASFWNSYQANRNRAAWDAYQAAVMEGDVELNSLQRLASGEDFAGTDVQEWALLGWADRQLLLASRTYLSDRNAAKEKLANIVDIYQGFSETGSTPEIRNRARLGLARLHEMQGDVEKAKQGYQAVEGALAAIAEDRIKTLESEQTQATINWLATVDLPKPAKPTGPGTPGDRPGFEASTPATDPLGTTGGAAGSESLEDILSGINSGAAPAAGTTPATPATPAEPSTAEAPAPTAAVDAAPAATESAAAPPASEADDSASTGEGAASTPAVEQTPAEDASAAETADEAAAAGETAPAVEETPAADAAAPQ